jgi:hypothetical protein
MTAIRSGATLGGPGKLLAECAVDNMNTDSAKYQSRAGRLPPGKGYYVWEKDKDGKPVGEPVQFDGYLQPTKRYKEGRLIDTKFYEASGKFVRSYSIATNSSILTGFSKYSIRKADKLIEQARRQLSVADGTPVVWRVASVEAHAALCQLFERTEDLKEEIGKGKFEVEVFPKPGQSS